MMQNSMHSETKDKSKARRRRSLPLIRLAMDPNSKLNMPKTLENIGTIARNSFEDKHAPMYHVRNMIGSVKNAFLSGLRMAPQDIILPSQYRIIDTKEEMVMKPADIEAIKTRAAAEATAEAESRAARERDAERRREALHPPKALETVRALPPPDFFANLSNLKNLRDTFRNTFKNPFGPKITPKTRSAFDESALRRKAFDLDTHGDDAPVLGSRIRSDENEVDPFDFLKTFQKVGTVVRGSIKSGQETIQHISEAAHSARKAYNTARFGAPRVLLPYARAPVLEHDNKFMFVAPRFLDIGKEEPLIRDTTPPMVGMGEIMNAFGVANPEHDKVQKQRIIIEKTKLPQPGKIPILQGRFADVGNDDPLNPIDNNDNQYYIYAEDIDDIQDEPLDTDSKVGDALESLQSLKDIMGARTITEFLDEMKKDFTSMHYTRKAHEIQDLQNQLTDAQVTSRIAEENEEEEMELKRFLNDLFADQTAKIERSDEEARLQQSAPKSGKPVEAKSPTIKDELVGSKLFLPDNLLKPFMNQPNTEQLNDYFRENGDFEEVTNDRNENLNNFLRMHALVAAINPKMYQELFNETLKINPNASVLHPENLFNYTKLGMVPNIQPIEPGPIYPVGDNIENNFVQMRSQFSEPEKQNLAESGTTPMDPKSSTPKTEMVDQKLQDEDEEKKRISMHFHEKLTKPFMGKVKPKTEYYYDYGYDDNY